MKIDYNLLLIFFVLMFFEFSRNRFFREAFLLEIE